MTTSRTVAAGEARLTLPDHWWVVPLGPADARRSSVERLVARQFAGLDDQPRLRADVRRALLDQADRAAAADARLLALSLLQVAGIPVPASLVVHVLAVPVDPLDPAGAGAVLEALQSRLRPPPGEPPPSGFTLDLGRLPPGPVLRRVHTESAPLEGAEPLLSLVADYWIQRPDGTGLVQLAFATPLIDLRDAMLELFDAITGALHWTTGDETD